MKIHWKDWCWSWNSNTLTFWCKEPTPIEKDPDAGKERRQEEKEMAEDKMVGWRHWLNGHEFEQALGDGGGQGNQVCCSPWGRKQKRQSNWRTNSLSLQSSYAHTHTHTHTGGRFLLSNYQEMQYFLLETSIPPQISLEARCQIEL